MYTTLCVKGREGMEKKREIARAEGISNEIRAGGGEKKVYQPTKWGSRKILFADPGGNRLAGGVAERNRKRSTAE